MKTSILILTLLSVALGAPQSSKLRLHNNIKKPLSELNSVSPRIIGGNIAEPHSLPYQALLEFYGEYLAWYCGGTLISQNYVITSGTCASTSLEVLVTLGAHNVFLVEPTQVNVFSTDITFHDNYDPRDYINDLAVIKLPKPVTFTDAIQAIPLAPKTDVEVIYIGLIGRIAGWGSEDGFDETLFDLLRYTDIQVLGSLDEPCRSLAMPLPPSMFCTSGETEEIDVGACNADEGAGFVVDGVLLGVYSFGVVYCLEGYPSAFTKIANFRDWIEANTDIVTN